MTTAMWDKELDFVEAVAKTQDFLRKRPAAHPEVFLTSSEKGDGIAQLRAEIAMLADPSA